MSHTSPSRCSIGLLLLAALSAWPLTAQEAKKTYLIQGEVYEARSGEPLVGANVVIDGTNYGASTNLEGKFFINAQLAPFFCISMKSFNNCQRTGEIS